MFTFINQFSSLIDLFCFIHILDDITSKVKGKGCVPVCYPGSMNFGLVRTTTSCCSTDLCNRQDAPGIVLK